MKRRKRTELMCHCSLDHLKIMVERIEEQRHITTIKPAATGLIMIKMRDSAQLQLFYLGEVLVTECKVEIDSHVGIGIVRGVQEVRATYMATIDAAFNAGLPITAELIEKLNEISAQYTNNKKAYNAQILKTKVDFETLYEEVKS